MRNKRSMLLLGDDRYQLVENKVNSIMVRVRAYGRVVSVEPRFPQMKR